MIWGGSARAGEVCEPAPAGLAARLLAQSGEEFDPPWGKAPPRAVHSLTYDEDLSATENGARLAARAAELVPGDRLEVGAGTWSVERYWDLRLVGTEEAPIALVAAEGARPVLTRPDARQNVLNLGAGGAMRYFVLRGFELTGGSAGLRLGDCREVWIDRNEIHHVGEAGLTANQHDTERLFLTRNRIHHTAGHGEGMYLGGNHGAVVMSRSIIALNHVHDTGGLQGDGIEVKQGSWGNLIAANFVHDTKFPCLLVYGTGGRAPNVLEGNLLLRSRDNVLQVQGEAIVRNNLVVGGAAGLHSHDHQGSTRDLVVVHNTILNEGRGARLVNWSGRPGLVFANNLVYSGAAGALEFSGGARGVTLAGNVVLGRVSGTSEGFLVGGGLSDFVAASWDGTLSEALPRPDTAPVGAADPAWIPALDLLGRPRSDARVAGCLDLLSGAK